jgi:hypothetical protein
VTELPETPKPEAISPAPVPAPTRIYALGRFGRWIGRMFGGSHRRTGARDTDPGS